jgi:hypothetical protein
MATGEECNTGLPISGSANLSTSSKASGNGINFQITRERSNMASTSVALTLLDWPRDVLLTLLDHCPRSTLNALARTCRTMHAYSLSLLYENLDLSDENLRLLVQKKVPVVGLCQRTTVRYILENQDLAKRVKRFKFGMQEFRYDTESLDKLCQLIGLFENLEHVEIIGLEDIFAPVSKYDIAEQILPNLKSIILRNHVPLRLIEAVLLGCEKPRLETVEMDYKLFYTRRQVFRKNDSKHGWPHGIIYLHDLIAYRAPTLKVFKLQGSELEFVSNPEITRRDLSLKELKRMWLEQASEVGDSGIISPKNGTNNNTQPV